MNEKEQYSETLSKLLSAHNERDATEETTYLLSTPANMERLLRSIEKHKATTDLA